MLRVKRHVQCEARCDVSLRAGSTATWNNLDVEPNTVVNDAGIPGVYRILCGIHPNMKQTITVQ